MSAYSPALELPAPPPTVYVWCENGIWSFMTKEGDVWLDGLATYNDAFRMIEDQVGLGVAIIYERPSKSILKKRAESGKISAPVSAHQTDKVSAPAPLETDPSTIPAEEPLHYVLKIDADLLPLLRAAVEREADRTISRIETEQGTKDLLPYERKAVIESNHSRLHQLHNLIEQLPQPQQ